MSYLMQRTRIRGRRLPDFLITLGSGSPSVVIALGLIMSMQGRFGVNIYNTAYILIVAYLIKYMMMGMRTATSAISQIHISLEESSQVSGLPGRRPCAVLQTRSSSPPSLRGGSSSLFPVSTSCP
jgi:iron(III) transport system permease protein